jgi:hypothetical protein
VRKYAVHFLVNDDSACSAENKRESSDQFGCVFFHEDENSERDRSLSHRLTTILLFRFAAIAFAIAGAGTTGVVLFFAAGTIAGAIVAAALLFFFFGVHIYRFITID